MSAISREEHFRKKIRRAEAKIQLIKHYKKQNTAKEALHILTGKPRTSSFESTERDLDNHQRYWEYKLERLRKELNEYYKQAMKPKETIDDDRK